MAKSKKRTKKQTSKKIWRYSDANTHTDNLTFAEALKFQRQQNGGTVTRMPSKSVIDARAGLIPSEETDLLLHSNICDVHCGGPCDCGVDEPEPVVPEPSTIHLFMEGGVIHDIQNIPSNVAVKVYDYDTEGADADRIVKDGKGEECVVTEWNNKSQNSVACVPNLNPSELATILASLRLWQSSVGTDGFPAQANATADFGPYFAEARTLSLKEIDQLCERLNG